jgi:hypothetical protein
LFYDDSRVVSLIGLRVWWFLRCLHLIYSILKILDGGLLVSYMW